MTRPLENMLFLVERDIQSNLDSLLVKKAYFRKLVNNLLFRHDHRRNTKYHVVAIPGPRENNMLSSFVKRALETWTAFIIMLACMSLITVTGLLPGVTGQYWAMLEILTKAYFPEGLYNVTFDIIFYVELTPNTIVRIEHSKNHYSVF